MRRSILARCPTATDNTHRPPQPCPSGPRGGGRALVPGSRHTKRDGKGEDGDIDVPCPGATAERAASSRQSPSIPLSGCGAAPWQPGSRGSGGPVLSPRHSAAWEHGWEVTPRATCHRLLPARGGGLQEASSAPWGGGAWWGGSILRAHGGVTGATAGTWRSLPQVTLRAWGAWILVCHHVTGLGQRRR